MAMIVYNTLLMMWDLMPSETKTNIIILMAHTQRASVTFSSLYYPFNHKKWLFINADIRQMVVRSHT